MGLTYLSLVVKQKQKLLGSEFVQDNRLIVRWSYEFRKRCESQVWPSLLQILPGAVPQYLEVEG